MGVQDVSNLKRCPGYKHTKPGGTPSCGNVWDASPPPYGEGALCPKCWHKPARTGKRIVALDGSEKKIPEAALNLRDESKNKTVVEEQELVTATGQNWEEAEFDHQIKKKKSERPAWARWGKK